VARPNGTLFPQRLAPRRPLPVLERHPGTSRHQPVPPISVLVHAGETRRATSPSAMSVAGGHESAALRWPGMFAFSAGPLLPATVDVAAVAPNPGRSSAHACIPIRRPGDPPECSATPGRCLRTPRRARAPITWDRTPRFRHRLLGAWSAVPDQRPGWTGEPVCRAVHQPGRWAVAV